VVASAKFSARLDTWFLRRFETYDPRLHKALGLHHD
jgi:hypothetical protein